LTRQDIVSSIESDPIDIHSKEFKVEAVRLAAESDKPVTQVARELGLRVNQWCRLVFIIS